MALPLIDFGIILLYLLGIVAFGCYFIRGNTTAAQFMAASGSLPGWVVGLSILGTFVSSISFLANPGASFAGNWNPFVFGLSLPLAALIATRFFVPFYRQIGAFSAYEHLEQRFGTWARLYAVACYLLTQVARVGTILYLVALAIAPLILRDVSEQQTLIIGTILICGFLVTLYTLMGGIEAVIWTDVVQAVVLVGGLVACVLVLLTRMPGGPDTIWEIATAHDKFSLGSLNWSFTTSTFWLMLFYGLTINLQNFAIDQNYVQRYISAKNIPAARRSVWIGALGYLPISAILFFIGTALFAFYTTHANSLPPNIKNDQVFPYFIVVEVPVGITGLLVSAILAAAMSTVDTSLNSSATVLLQDVYRRFVHPDADDQAQLRFLKRATIAAGIVGTLVALAMLEAETVLQVWWTLAGLLGGGMLGLFLLGRLAPHVGGPAAAIGVIAGVLVSLWAIGSRTTYWPKPLAPFASPFHEHLTIVLATLTILTIGTLAGLLIPRDPQSVPSPAHSPD